MPSQTVVLTIRLLSTSNISAEDRQALIEKLARFQPVQDLMGDYIASLQRRNFEDHGETFGQPWAPLSEATRREKQRLGFPDIPLVRTGDLRDNIAIARSSNGQAVTVGIPPSIPYAKYQDEKRVLVGIAADELDTLAKLLQEYLAENTGSAGAQIEIRAEVR